MDEVLFLYTTWPDAETAETFAAEAVAERLAACANVLAPMRAIYRWKGAVERAAEVPMILKATTATAEALKALLLERHPYEVPCLVALPVAPEGSNPEFLAWVVEQTRADQERS
ncbi:MAG TPA: divalent-cation tolerance protein CutA [Caulobacteraceae bacterium]|nr:divalent-cation tolerance protein CutA [Caulobacteraceae bacterium]